MVIACNTASTLVLPPLRERFAVPFVGTVPAIKPAAEQTKSGVVAVLATPGTMKRDYTRELIRSFARECHVRLVGAPDLARLAEARMRGEAIDRASVAGQIAPCFVEDGGAADRHRRARLHALSVPRPTSWPILRRGRSTWLDPAPAIARRLVAVLDGGSAAQGGESVARFTSGRSMPESLRRLLEAHRLATA